jgi:hypothetical protein
MLALLAAATLVLRVRPEWVLGLGLHCGLETLFGLKCPFCGMTRDFAAMLHGHRPALNPASAFMACVVYGVYPVAVAAAWRRRRFDWFSKPWVYRVLAVCLVTMFLLNNLV